MIKKGFTIGELAITVAIVGLISAVMLPVLKDIQPSKEASLFKKSHYLAQKVIADLIANEDLYPLKEDVSDGNWQAILTQKDGFGNLSKVENYKNLSIPENSNGKFCNLFAANMKLASDVDCTTTKNFPQGNFKTTDGVTWVMPITAFGLPTFTFPIYIDVNGEDGPNCFHTKTNGCREPDRFTMHVYSDGKTTIYGTAEKLYLKTSKVTRKELEEELRDAPEGIDVTEVNESALKQGCLNGQQAILQQTGPVVNVGNIVNKIQFK